MHHTYFPLSQETTRNESKAMFVYEGLRKETFLTIVHLQRPFSSMMDTCGNAKASIRRQGRTWAISARSVARLFISKKFVIALKNFKDEEE